MFTRRLTAASLLTALLLATGQLGALARPSDGGNLGIGDDWSRLRAPLRAAGIDPGGRVDEADIVRAKDVLRVPVGRRIDAADVDRIVDAATRRSVEGLRKAGVDPGGRVDEEDLVRAKVVLDVPVGGRVDPQDAARILAVAEAATPPPPRARRPQARPAARVPARPEERPAADRGGYRPVPGSLPVFATVAGTELRLPSDRVRLVGFHQAAYRDVSGLRPARRPGMATLSSRGRGTHRRSAADIAMPLGETVLSPVGGRVVEVSHYRLYGRTADVRIRIVPWQNPRLVVTVLHVRDPKVKVGTEVHAGHTPLAGSANLLPFRSQIDREVGRMPHVHVEVRGR